MSTRLLLSGALLVLASALSFRDEAPRAVRLELEFAGCARVRPGPVCELAANRELTLWVPGSIRPELELGSGARVRAGQFAFVESGFLIKLRAPRPAPTLRVRVGASRAELRLVENTEPPPLQELARLWKEGSWDRVRASLDAAAGELEGPERERIDAFRARLALRDGNNARAVLELVQSADRAHRAGLLLEASHDRFAAAYGHAVRLGDYEAARGELRRVERELAEVPETRARLSYYRGVIAKTTGDARGALLHFRRASVLARRLDNVTDELLSRQELALTLNRLIRHGEALAEQRAVVGRELSTPGCLHSLRWENLAWILLSQPDRDLQSQASEALDQAERLLAGCPDPLSRRNQALNRVELALLRGEAGEAETRLQLLERDVTGSNTRLAAWQALYSGRVRLLREDLDGAQAAFERAEKLAEGAQHRDCSYLAKLGRARALARKNDARALAAYLEAEDAADALVRWAPFGQGNQLTALDVQDSSRELLSFLLERGEAAQAYAVAARAARRASTSSFRENRIAALGGARRQRWERAVSEYLRRRQSFERLARDDWKLSREGLSEVRLTRALELQKLEDALAEVYALLSHERAPVGPTGRALEAGEALQTAADRAELTLAAGSDGSWAFLAQGGVLHVERVTDSLELARIESGLPAVLELFLEQGLLDAPLLQVRLPPELVALDVHALEVHGRPVLEHLPVAYGLEPGRASGHVVRSGAGQRLLVLGDPSSDLGWSGAEARRLASRLPGSEVLIGEQVSFDSVIRALPGATLLHFAGHASSGGIDGLDGGLRLAAGRSLSLGDVFALPSVPELVVLSACSGSVSPGRGGGLSIGQAFLAAGSRAVLGASRAVSDSLAERFMQAFYDALLGSGAKATLPRDARAWAIAARAAALQVKREHPSSDWASMRLLMP